MNTRRFVISDTHFGHANILTFKREDGSPLRDFATIQEHDETLIGNWNRTVGPEDVVYHLGDAVINRRYLKTLGRLNGRKRLIRGNHDIFPTSEYLPYFEEIYGVLVLPKMHLVMSHIPLHPDSVARWKLNVHGHLHAGNVNDPRYINVSCEQVNYTPADLDELLTRSEIT